MMQALAGCLCQGVIWILVKKRRGDGAKTDCLKNANCENKGTDDAYFSTAALVLLQHLGDCAQFQTFGFHLINLPVGLVGENFIVIYEEEFVYLLEGTGVALIGRDILQGEAEILVVNWLVVRRMIT